MPTHPLHRLGFEPIAARSLAQLGFEPATRPMPAAQPSAVNAKVRNDASHSRDGVSRAPAIVKGSVVKGSRVRLTDGSLARVAYVDPNMRIARVRTDDGRNITVRRKDLCSPL